MSNPITRIALLIFVQRHGALTSPHPCLPKLLPLLSETNGLQLLIEARAGYWMPAMQVTSQTGPPTLGPFMTAVYRSLESMVEE